MTNKISFECPECHESFNIFVVYLATKASIKCPNCEKEFPQSNFEALKELPGIMDRATDGMITVDENNNVDKSNFWILRFICDD